MLVFMSFFDSFFVFFMMFLTINGIYFFLLLNSKSTFLTTSSLKKIKHASSTKNTNVNLIFSMNILFLLFNILFLFVYKSHNQFMWFNHLYLSNMVIFLLMLFTLFMLVMFFLLSNQIMSLLKINFEYFFAMLFMNMFLPLMFCATNMLTFFFIIELTSCLMLFKFVVGSDWELLTSAKKSQFFNYSNFNNSTSYINIIFFQYWVSFFSSVLMVYSLLMFLFYYGTTEWMLLNFLSNLDLTWNTINNNFNIMMVFFIFFTGFFLKLGLAPVHLYKMELYKGLPFMSILFYTMYFFFIFFIFFILLLVYYFNNMTIMWFNIGMVFSIMGVMLVMFLLFDTTSLRAFFAYSTVVNSMAFFALMISLLN